MPVAASLLIQAFLWLFLFINIPQGEGQIFLHYNIVIGVDKVGNWWRIFYLPAIGVMVLLVNVIFGLFVYRADKFLARVLTGWVLLFHIFLLAGIIFLVRLNS